MSSAPQLRPLTAREQRVAAVMRRVFPADRVLVGFAALLGALSRNLVSGICNAPDGGPFGGPAAAYCSTVGHGWSWGAFIGAAVAIVVALRLLARHWRFRRQVTVALLVAALVANVAITVSLPGYLAP